MELTVRPDDLAAAAAALRRVHDDLSRDCADFTSAALRLVPALGPQAAETARSTVRASAHSCASAQDDLAAFSHGLVAAAGYYAAVDRQALGRVR